MLTPGSGTLPALTVPCTTPPTARVVGVEGEGAGVEAGGGGVDCALAGVTGRIVTTRLANRHINDAKSREIWGSRGCCGERSWLSFLSFMGAAWTLRLEREHFGDRVVACHISPESSLGRWRSRGRSSRGWSRLRSGGRGSRWWRLARPAGMGSSSSPEAASPEASGSRWHNAQGGGQERIRMHCTLGADE